MSLIINTNIKGYLKLFDISGRALAEEAGLSKGTVSAILTGKYNPSLETLFYMAKIFECSIADLLDENEKDLKFKLALKEAKGIGMTSDEDFKKTYFLPKPIPLSEEQQKAIDQHSALVDKYRI